MVWAPSAEKLDTPNGATPPGDQLRYPLFRFSFRPPSAAGDPLPPVQSFTIAGNASPQDYSFDPAIIQAVYYAMRAHGFKEIAVMRQGLNYQSLTSAPL